MNNAYEDGRAGMRISGAPDAALAKTNPQVCEGFDTMSTILLVICNELTTVRPNRSMRFGGAADRQLRAGVDESRST